MKRAHFRSREHKITFHSIESIIIMSTAKKENPKVTRAEKELMTAKDELEILKEAKPLSATCGELTEFSEREEEPFSATHVEANAWHKSEGGGCIIL